MKTNQIIFIVGPTAVGKSEMACHCARAIEGEIISCDSMQVYKEISIASNKPPAEILESVPHHLVNILSVEEEFDVARFNTLARSVIKDIWQRGRVPVIAGGSGLYMQILLDGIFKGGVKNEQVRRDLKEQARRRGNQYLYAKLKEEDPKAAGKIHPNDVRRVIRALEVSMTERLPISTLQVDRDGLWGTCDIACFALNMERRSLYERIDRRVEDMFDRGLVDEIRNCDGLAFSQTAGKIIGVEEVRAYIKEETGLEETKAKMKLNTRHLAKRQLTWFRREQRLEWINIGPDDRARQSAEDIIHQWKSGRAATRL